MTISALIPSFRSTEYLEEAVQSLLIQTKKPDEIIVLTELKDGGASEVLKPYLKNGLVKLIINKVDGNHMKVEKKFNMLGGLAKGEAIFFLCEDDKVSYNFIEKTTEAMTENVDIVYTDALRIGSKYGSFLGNPGEVMKAVSNWEQHNWELCPASYITSLIRKSLWDRLGGWDEELLSMGDWDFYWRAWESGAKFKYIPLPLFLYRIHDKQDSFAIDYSKCREVVINKHFKKYEKTENTLH